MSGSDAQAKPLSGDLLKWASSFTGLDVTTKANASGGLKAAQGAAPDAAGKRGTDVPRPMPPGTKVVHGKVLGPKNHLLTDPDGFVVDVDAKMIIANSLAEYKSSKPAQPGQGASPAPQPEARAAQQPAPEPDGADEAAGGSGRGAVAAAAKAMMGRGTIHALALGGPENLRQGWEDLLEMFQLAAPSFVGQPGWVEKVLKHSGEVGTAKGIPHWCGILALYATKTGGVSVGTWKMGGGIASVGGFRPIKAKEVGVGDILVKKAKTHHALVIEVNGDKVTVINGNSGTDSCITQSSGKVSDYDGGCYSAFSK